MHLTPLTVLHASIFKASKELHELRYELTSGGLQKDLPDILWEHEHLEGLYDTALEHFIEMSMNDYDSSKNEELNHIILTYNI